MRLLLQTSGAFQAPSPQGPAWLRLAPATAVPPCPADPVRRRRPGAASLMMMSNCSRPAILYMLKVPYLELLATSTTWSPTSMSSATSTFSADGVVMPRRRSRGWWR